MESENLWHFGYYCNDFWFISFKNWFLMAHYPRNIGKFGISRHLIFNKTELAAKIFRSLDIIILKAEYSFTSDIIEYIGISPKFKEVPEGEGPIEYDIMIKEKDDVDIYIENKSKNKIVEPKRLIELVIE